MGQVFKRSGFNGSALIRLLSRLAEADVREPANPAADRLSQWFGWTDAISLSPRSTARPQRRKPAFALPATPKKANATA